MEDFREQVLWKVRAFPGLTDREITDSLLGKAARIQAVNWAAHSLEKKRLLERHLRPDGKIGNYAVGCREGNFRECRPENVSADSRTPVVQMSEGEVKKKIKEWLEDEGWSVAVECGADPGADIEAGRGSERWVIEAKGSGSRNEMRSNHFLSVLGETLRRMDDPQASYSIALPDMRKFRNLWARFPALAKTRTGISALFVGIDGKVDQVY
jgi:hypothetical protein